MAKTLLVAVLGLTLIACLNGCGDREQLRAEQVADEASLSSEDDANCREKGEPGTEFYDECRKNLAAVRAERSAIQYQKNRDFDRVLGRGTSDYE